MKEGGCPITKMFKFAGTPQMGAVLIVLFVILGALTFFVLEGFKDQQIRYQQVVKQLNALSSGAEPSEQEDIEKGLERLGQARGYIKIMNEPGKEPLDAKKVSVRSFQDDTAQDKAQPRKSDPVTNP